MITLQELNRHDYHTTPEIDDNLLELQRRLNIVRLQYNQPMLVTSGLRSEYQQQLIADGKSTATKSKHLTGQAADISDDGAIKPWVLANVPLMEEVGLWMETFDATPNWVHFQTVAPNSGNRFFNP